MTRRLFPLLVLPLFGCPDQNIGTFNTPPEAVITLPADGSSLQTNTVTFGGRVNDAQDNPQDLVVQWTTTLAPDLPLNTDAPDTEGFMQFTAQGLASGTHLIELLVTDTRGATDSDTVEITILTDPPLVNIEEPLTGALYYAGNPIEFRGRVSNSDETEFDLSVVWTSDLDGELRVGNADSEGLTVFTGALNAGFHTITLTATDGVGVVGSASKVIEVSDFPVGQLDQDGDGWCPDGQDLNGDGECDDTELVGQPGSNDCNDLEPLAYPGAAEECDGIPDNNCDGILDETDIDNDGDGWSACQGDCVDIATVEFPVPAVIYPGAAEVCDGYDNNCDAVTLPGEVDADLDTYFVCDGDCDDNDNAVSPGATEVCNEIDDNCDGTIDEGFDADGDGYATCTGDCDDTDANIHPNAVEICNDWDDDCDGVVNENADPTEVGETIPAVPDGIDQYVDLATFARIIAFPPITTCQFGTCTAIFDGALQLCENSAATTGAFASAWDAFDAFRVEYTTATGTLAGCPFTVNLSVPPGNDYALHLYGADIGSPPNTWDLLAQSDNPGNATETITYQDLDLSTLFGGQDFVIVVLSKGYHACPGSAYSLTVSGF
jgi:hypothetical protein